MGDSNRAIADHPACAFSFSSPRRRLQCFYMLAEGGWPWADFDRFDWSVHNLARMTWLGPNSPLLLVLVNTCRDRKATITTSPHPNDDRCASLPFYFDACLSVSPSVCLSVCVCPFTGIISLPILLSLLYPSTTSPTLVRSPFHSALPSLYCCSMAISTCGVPLSFFLHK